jgi:hypothetical protein
MKSSAGVDSMKLILASNIEISNQLKEVESKE